MLELCWLRSGRCRFVKQAKRLRRARLGIQCESEVRSEGSAEDVGSAIIGSPRAHEVDDCCDPFRALVEDRVPDVGALRSRVSKLWNCVVFQTLCDILDAWS